MKDKAYQTMLGGDYIDAYYQFLTLSKLTPLDPEVKEFLSRCQTQTEQTAFFTNQINMLDGEIVSDALFSSPAFDPETGATGGRVVLRIGSLCAQPDQAWAMNIEAYIFSDNGSIINHVSAPYARIVPRSLKSGDVTTLLMKALDPGDPSWQWKPAWDEAVSAEDEPMLFLGMDYNTFYLLTQIRERPGNLSMLELNQTLKLGPQYGIIRQVYQAEIYRRIAEPLLFLPLLGFSLLIAWRFRSRRKVGLPSYLMLIILPLVAGGFIQLYRVFISTISIALSMSMQSIVVYVALGGITLLLYLLSLICLTAQR
jgi:hypothetical protein